ncbi:histidine ammonia-lyase-like [Osmerus eperlanus]|uniref:histidine ammonia-lyase-like n=1 Tax=Osmerus eperlanus TaxID=29151 RepID=UPI002E122361
MVYTPHRGGQEEGQGLEVSGRKDEGQNGEPGGGGGVWYLSSVSEFREDEGFWMTCSGEGRELHGTFSRLDVRKAREKAISPMTWTPGGQTDRPISFDGAETDPSSMSACYRGPVLMVNRMAGFTLADLALSLALQAAGPLPPHRLWKYPEEVCPAGMGGELLYPDDAINDVLKDKDFVELMSCLSWVPEKGMVGASGDLAPLAHLTLGWMGEGRMWSPQSGWAPAKAVLEGHGLAPLVLKPKEGVALINGTQLMTSLGAEAVERALGVEKQADIIAALSLEALRGTNKAFDHDIHAVRPHPGQIEVAMRLRSLLDSDIFHSQISDSHRSCNLVKDAYTLRCIPQVHGVAIDTVAVVQKVISTELNSATDNRLVFAKRSETISAGNVHGEYPAKALDFLAIGVHEMSNMSERSTERLVNPSLSELPAFLVAEGDLKSGFMIAHCTAAALVSESKALCHPLSVDSLSTSAATEDVSMGGWAARKALSVLEHVEKGK